MSSSNTRWAKIWVDPPSIWPNAGLNNTKLAQLDHQIALAKFAGWNVILTINPRYPSWINASADPSALPTSTGNRSNFAVFLWFLAQRYSAATPAANRPEGGYAVVDIIEPLNEPNHMASGDPGINSARVGDLMLTAKQIVAMTGNTPIVAGPALADDYGSSASSTVASFDTFTSNVLARLQANGFYSQPNNHVFVWSQHNYGDALYDLGTNSAYHDSNVANPALNVGDIRTARVRRTRDLLAAGNWHGWPDGGSIPYIMLTEGGIRPVDVPKRWTAGSGLTGNGGQDGQAFLLASNWTRMRTNVDGLGVVLGTQFLWYDTYAGDYSGLLTTPTPYTPRPALNVWAGLPSG